MKRLLAITLSVSMLFSTAVYASTGTGTAKTAHEQVQQVEEMAEAVSEFEEAHKIDSMLDAPAASDESPDWTLPDTIEMTSTVTEVFNKAIKGLVGVKYKPLGYLGEKEGTYCILCRATVVYPGAKPYYALVYVNDAGVQNIWEIWMDKHADKTDEQALQESSYENNEDGDSADLNGYTLRVDGKEYTEGTKHAGKVIEITIKKESGRGMQAHSHGKMKPSKDDDRHHSKPE